MANAILQIRNGTTQKPDKKHERKSEPSPFCNPQNSQQQNSIKAVSKRNKIKNIRVFEDVQRYFR